MADEDSLKSAGLPDERTFSTPLTKKAGDADTKPTPDTTRKFKEFNGKPLSGLLKEVPGIGAPYKNDEGILVLTTIRALHRADITNSFQLVGKYLSLITDELDPEAEEDIFVRTSEEVVKKSFKLWLDDVGVVKRCEKEISEGIAVWVNKCFPQAFGDVETSPKTKSNFAISSLSGRLKDVPGIGARKNKDGIPVQTTIRALHRVGITNSFQLVGKYLSLIADEGDLEEKCFVRTSMEEVCDRYYYWLEAVGVVKAQKSNITEGIADKVDVNFPKAFPGEEGGGGGKKGGDPAIRSLESALKDVSLEKENDVSLKEDVGIP